MIYASYGKDTNFLTIIKLSKILNKYILPDLNYMIPLFFQSSLIKSTKFIKTKGWITTLGNII